MRVGGSVARVDGGQRGRRSVRRARREPDGARGGCDGQLGGAAGAATAGAPGPAAVPWFLTASKITLSPGLIKRVWLRRGCCRLAPGGSGGGSGGMIVLHAGRIDQRETGREADGETAAAVIGANDTTAATFGDDQASATPTTPARAADAGQQRRPGGAGFAGATNAVTGQSAGGNRDTGVAAVWRRGFIQAN